MRKIVLLFCAIICANVLMAQQQLATLNHNDTISVFYGTNSFVEAYNAAADGDIITLSDGVFKPCDITKSITLRGNGAIADTARGTMGTQFFERFNVSFYNNKHIQFEVEGIYFKELYTYGNSINIKLIKCITDYFTCGEYVSSEAISCIIQNAFGANGYDIETSNTAYTNTYINSVLNSTYLPSYSSCTNCIIIGKDNSSSKSEHFVNCIVINTNSSDTLLNRNCDYSILCGLSAIYNNYLQGNVFMDVEDVFEEWDGSTIQYSEDAYRLKDGVASSVLGVDGTQVGIYGGVMPFDLTPSYSVIKKCNVANRTTADGKLSVDIEVVTE